MTGYQKLLLLLGVTLCLHLGYAVPITEGHHEIPYHMESLPGYAVFLISAAAILLLGYVVIGCVCCPNHNIKALSYQNGFPVSRLNDNSLQFENPSEFAIFPPHSAVIDLQPVSLSYPIFEDKVTFEPLPDILPRKLSGQSAACSSRPAHFRALLKNKISLHDWFNDPISNFPRDQLQYIRELGCGWFGRVVEGEASNINNSEEKTAVLVKILREEASPSEHLHFLHEVRPYRDLAHPNVVRLLGRCLESDPFLLIMEHSISDLKTFLVLHENKESFIKNGMLLQMACNVAAGLKCLHENGYTHMDLAAHNCFVCKDFTVKVGDYGISFDKCREDYYCLGGIALPIRWCSPETLLCTDATIETKEITKESNVWAFGIILWEIFEFGKLPYEELTNEEVLQKVLIEKTIQLNAPSQEFPVKEELYLIMKECWKPAHLRPTMEKVEKFLTPLYNDRHNLKTLETSFEERWNSLPPKIGDTKLLGTDLTHLKFENDFSDKSDSHNYSSDGERFSSFEMSYDMASKSIGSHLSPSLRVLNGSIDELTENDGCLNSVSLGCEKSTTDAVSVDSDVLQLEDDQGNQMRDDVRDQHSLKRQLHGKKNANPFISEDSLDAVSKENDLKIDCYDVKTLPNLNVLKTLDSNSNELNIDSENLNWVHAHKLDGLEIYVENNPDSINDNSILYCEKKNEATENALGLISAPEDFSDQINSCKHGLNTIPDIIIHELASTADNSHDENENMMEDCSGQRSYSEAVKPFRFVFKDESVPSIDKSAVKISEVVSSGQDTPNATDSSLEKTPVDLKSKLRSRHLTSTPIKSDHDINLNCSNSVAEDDDSGNVFYDNNYDVKNSNSSLYEESALKSESTVETKPNPFYEKDSENVLKMPTFNDTSDVLQNKSDVSTSNNQIVVSIPLPIFNSEINEHSSSVAGLKHSDASEIECFQKLQFSPEKSNLHDSDPMNPEDAASANFGESITPEVSFNVSSCSYGNDFRSISTDSPGVSSSNKDLDYDSPIKKYDPNMHCEIGFATTPECLVKDVEYHNHMEFLDSGTTQDIRTLDSEASGSEYLESFSPDATPSHSDEKRMESINNMRPVKLNFQSISAMNKRDLLYDEDDLENDSESDTNAYKSKSELCLHPYDEVIVEDLETGEQTIITESFSACDDFDNSADSDEILKINIETDEAIIVDSSEALIGFVPSRSIELLQECEIIPTLNPSFTVEDEKEPEDPNHLDGFNSTSSSPVVMQSASSPCESPESIHPLHQPYRNFSLQNEVIEEEITDEIATPSSIHSTASFSSNEDFVEEEKMSQSSESYSEEICETSVLPSMDHFFNESNDGSRSDISNSDCSPVHGENGVVNNIYYVKDYENNRVCKDLQDVMYSKQPTQSVCWHSDETLDIERNSPVILEGQEILAGGVLETCEMSVKDITATLNQLEADDSLNRQTLNQLSISHSPSPYSSLESSPCREAYTPDFESDSDDGGTSCSSTSGSFECIHNKFKETIDVSKAGNEIESSDSSREPSPKKIFSKTWDCHATPSKSVLVTPEKKFNSLRKSVSFHEEDPQIVFEYPPASDSSEDDHVQEEITPWNTAYNIFADWELHVPENEEPEIEEVLEIEELDSEPYVRRPTYGIGSSLGPMNRPMYSFTSGFSDDEMDLSEVLAMPSKSIAPSNSPEEGKHPSLSGDQISELIKNQLNNLALEESRLKWMQDELDQQSHEFNYINSALDRSPTSVHITEESGNPESLQVEPKNVTVPREISDSELTNSEEFKLNEKKNNLDLFSLNIKKNIKLTNELNDNDCHSNENQNDSVHLNDNDCHSNENQNESIQLNDNDCHSNEMNVRSSEPLESRCDFEVETNNFSESEKTEIELSNLLINFEESSCSPPADFSVLGSDYKYMLENDGPLVLKKDLSACPSNFSDFESDDNKQNLTFDAIQQNIDPLLHIFSPLEASDSKKVELLVDTSTSDEKLDGFSDDKKVPYKSVFADDNEQHNMSETAPLKFVEGNTRPNSAKNKLNSYKEISLDSLQNDFDNEKLNSSHTPVLDSNLTNDSLNPNLEKFADDEVKKILNLDSVISSQTEGKSCDFVTSELVVTESCNVADCQFLDELDEKASIFEETKMEAENDTTLISDILLVQNTTENQINNASETNLNGKVNHFISNENHKDVESFFPETRIFSEINCNDILFEKKVTEKSGSILDSEIDITFPNSDGCSEKLTANQEINPDKNYVDNNCYQFTSKIIDEMNKNVSFDHVEGGNNKNCSSDPKNEAYIRDNISPETVEFDSLNENCPSDDKILPEKDSLFKNEINSLVSNSDLGKESALNCTDLTKILEVTGKKNTVQKKLLEPLPQIVITPASESDVEDELEQYLHDQLEFFHGPSVTEGEDFSVTSQFSVRPFDDVFGSQSASHNSGNYIEAFNFEFESGDFFEDFIDDYSTEMSNNRRFPLDNGNYQWWESPEAPPMIEKSSDDDSISKPETSPQYCSSKDATHL
ncbi:uncharacterized protein LOC129988026 [Argiope bruennichi]|uniref:uncharacterized protein LOC129988026 n=1 Tax=Argiope bruennichi TaxID=94029 RepID=UPI00249463DB|nr:uncharacterized protein LOC129988026 [Argiope bruennichi]